MVQLAWWQRGIVYEIYPRSFMDANGDGVGDLRGIIDKLDYMSWLGVDALWLTPIFPSPMVDFGYDVSDYTDIDPVFGHLATMDALISEAHARGLKIVLDFVANHTSDITPGFWSRALPTPAPNATGTSGATRHRAAARPTTGCRNSAAAPGNGTTRQHAGAGADAVGAALLA